MYDISQAKNEILLLSVVPEKQFTGKVEKPANETVDDGHFGRKGRSLLETFYVVLVYKEKSSSTALTKMWKIVFSVSMNAVIGGKYIYELSYSFRQINCSQPLLDVE